MDLNTYILRHLKLNSVSDIAELGTLPIRKFEVGHISFAFTIAIA